jgi:uroporphyrinogen-III synthase
MLTFTSSSTVENFLQRITPVPPPDVPTLCIGPSTAKTATSYGFRQVLMPDTYTIEGMIQCILDYYTPSQLN